jgi:hypothetical protein
MAWGRLWIGLLVVSIITLNLGTARAWAEETTATKLPSIPLDEISTRSRDKVRAVIEHPTLHTTGPAETFACKPAQYHEFLDHPDKAVQMWRKLGAKCISITDRGKGRFGWADDKGNDIGWDTVYKDAKMRIWYAEGKVKPGTLIPTVPIRAVVVFHYTEGHDKKGRSLIRHRADLYFLTDSTAAALVARLLGPSAPRLAENYVTQLQTFFAALAWYCPQHPEVADKEK